MARITIVLIIIMLYTKQTLKKIQSISLYTSK